jgi:hypothetical protein
MEEFVHRQNLLLLRRRLDDPSFSEAERKIIRRLLAEEQAKNPGPRRIGQTKMQRLPLTSAGAVRRFSADTVPIPYSVKFRAT